MAFDQKTQANRIYEEFEPPSDWDHEEGSDTLILMLPGFKKEQLRVQVTSTRVLRVSGERQINESKYRRFRKEFPMPSDSETSGITAKFESGILYVKLPKLINKQSSPTTTTPPLPRQEAPIKPQQPIPTPQTVLNNAQVSDLKQPRVLVDKTVAEPKYEEHKPKKDKGKEELKDDANNNEVAKERVDEKKETGLEDRDELSNSEGKMIHKKSLTMEMLSLQRKEYMNAVSGLVDEVKKKKELINKLVLIFLVLLAGIYVKNVIKSYF